MVFIVYVGVVAAMTILPTHISRHSGPHEDHINLVPLGYSFTCFLQDRNAHPHLTAFCLRNTLGNLALFLPLGFLLPLVSNRFQLLKRVLLMALCISVSIEAIQFLLRFVGNPRAVDIDDVILNTLGACLGFALYKTFVASHVSGESTHDAKGHAERSAESIDSADL